MTGHLATYAPLAALSAAGVSIWLDDLSRERLVSGEPRANSVAGPPRRRGHHEPDDLCHKRIRQRRLQRPDPRLGRRRGVDVGEALRMTHDRRCARRLRCPAAASSTPPTAWTGGCRSRWTPDLLMTPSDHRSRGAGVVVAGRPTQPVHQDPRHPAGCRRSPRAWPRGSA